MTRHPAVMCQLGYKQFITEAAPDTDEKLAGVLSTRMIEPECVDGASPTYSIGLMNGVHRRYCFLSTPVHIVGGTTVVNYRRWGVHGPDVGAGGLVVPLCTAAVRIRASSASINLVE